MAGDWLKFEANTPEKPEVLAITIELGYDDPDLTVGKLLKVWRWFDQHTVNGNANNVTSALLDRLIGVTGITKAMSNVGWLVINDTCLTLPNFDRHNGKTAKDRALTAKRVAIYKASKFGNDDSVTSALPREEKRREDNKTIVTFIKSRFEEFWKSYPSSQRKVGKAACEKKWKSKQLDALAEKIINHVNAVKTTKQWSDGFAPAPLTYINQERWNDEVYQDEKSQPDWKRGML